MTRNPDFPAYIKFNIVTGVNRVNVLRRIALLCSLYHADAPPRHSPFANRDCPPLTRMLKTPHAFENEMHESEKVRK
ncbi:hypothetical protein KDW07_02660 [Burkholderia dolosa]|uniref:hypothetical protein n=1 Tax=Burkholderia dolosa TaxID=152500 RepID=UPI001B93C23F|nr:hypothetical protein [Burkholderia dolosa]MBR8456072.1 hypothetical protein [Burkholderia dolosa]MDN7420796.1 hypothetical protein [Burkholderia dolosa]